MCFCIPKFSSTFGMIKDSAINIIINLFPFLKIKIL